jgi:signal transduction histidine kinase
MPPLVSLFVTGPVRVVWTTFLPLGVGAAFISTFVATVVGLIEWRSDERAQLIRELEPTRPEVARLSREAGVTQERQRLAGEIHDTVAQRLSSVVMLVKAAAAILESNSGAAHEHLALAARTERENLAETRAIVAALTPRRRWAHRDPMQDDDWGAVRRGEPHRDGRRRPRSAPATHDRVSRSCSCGWPRKD